MSPSFPHVFPLLLSILPAAVTGRQNSQAEGNVVVVDAFDVQPDFAVLHWQDTNPDLNFTAGLLKSSGAHTLTNQVTNTDRSYVVVDAFDVRR